MTLTMDDLFPFQKEDVLKLADRKSVLIGNEMGSGKTYEAIALDLLRRTEEPRGKTLIICPLSSTRNTWLSHMERLAPELKGIVIDPKQRGLFLAALKDPAYDYYILHWDVLRIIEADLVKVFWFHIIADECHRAKNRKAQSTRALKKLKTRYKTAMSGTPITNKPHDFWSILNWLYPKEFKGYWNFYQNHVEYEIVYPQGFHKIVGAKNVDELLLQMDPWYVRHLKKEACCEHHPQGIMPELPDKYYAPPVWVELGPQQRKAYDQMNNDMIAWVGEHEDTPLVASVVIAKLVRLQQFAIAYAEVEFDGPDTFVRLSEPSAKLDAIMEILEDNPDEQFVIFSQFKQAINLLGKRLEAEGITTAIFTGDTPDADRQRYVSEFQSGERRVFAGTIKAGGVGLDLFAASTVIFLDRSWSPAENLQAEDRLHRHGQENAVEVIDIMARDTIDLGRKQLIEAKWQWIRALLGDLQKNWEMME